MPDLGLAQAIVLVVAVQRLAELLLARRNTARLLARGGVEHGTGHYPFIVLLHAAWLAALFLAVPADAPANWPLLAVFGALQVLRVWIVASLGPYWTTRVITVADAPLVRHGPYRWLRHPNYAVVVAEIAVLPLAFGQVKIALLFSAANAGLLWWRVRVESRALAGRLHDPEQASRAGA